VTPTLGAVEVRVQLPVLQRRRTHGNDAELPPREVESGTAQDLAVPLDHHDGVERRVQLAHVDAQLLVHPAVYRGASRLAARAPLLDVLDLLRLVRARRGRRCEPAPLARRVQGAGEAGEEVALHDELLDPLGGGHGRGSRESLADRALAGRADGGSEPDERDRGVVEHVEHDGGSWYAHL
jgi:hypothetical protein